MAPAPARDFLGPSWRDPIQDPVETAVNIQQVSSTSRGLPLPGSTSGRAMVGRRRSLRCTRSHINHEPSRAPRIVSRKFAFFEPLGNDPPHDGWLPRGRATIRWDEKEYSMGGTFLDTARAALDAATGRPAAPDDPPSLIPSGDPP